jgi:hypothetical protein
MDNPPSTIRLNKEDRKYMATLKKKMIAANIPERLCTQSEVLRYALKLASEESK